MQYNLIGDEIMVFRGSGVALVTPFNEDDVYKINYDEFKNLIRFHINNKTDSIIVCGTTGESATISDEEKMKLFKCAVDTSSKRIPIIAGTGSNDTRHAITLSIMAEKLGVNALLIVTPYYNKCTQEGLIKHYTAIASSVNIPIILYNVPSRTGVNILPETVLELAKLPNIVGIKEASGNLEQVSKIIELTKGLNSDFAVYSGNDEGIYDILELGGDGVISVLANVRPEDTHKICEEYFKGNKEKAQSIQTLYQPLIRALFSEVNPIPVKEALNIEGYEIGVPRLPLTPLTEENKNILKRELKKTEKE